MTISREDAQFWDKRTMDRRIRKGQLNRKDLEKHLKALPDVSGKSAPIELQNGIGVEDELDAEEAEA